MATDRAATEAGGASTLRETGRLFSAEELPVPAAEGLSGRYALHHVDAFQWLRQAEPQSIHAVVTDPPYGLIEYSELQLQKRANRSGGVWRIPPAFDGCERSPLPRFTVLGEAERRELRASFAGLGCGLMRVLVPGGHVFIATNPLVSHLVYEPLIGAGLEKRGEIIRLVQTLRGGDRPKNAEDEFPEVTVMPRSCWEPWGLFRKPCEGTVKQNLRRWRTGGLRRVSGKEPFKDVIEASVARGKEREIAPHPSLKPQNLVRKLVRAALPLGEGVVLDPFMGSGSTIAAAVACGYESIGLEVNAEYFQLASAAIPRLAALKVREKSSAGDSGGGRTHTFGVKNAASKLKGCAVYARRDVAIRDGKPVPRNGNGEH